MSKKITLLFLGFIVCVSMLNAQTPSQYVNPFVGTDDHGHTYPGAIVPFGAVQVSPDTRLDGWDGCSGYHYSDNTVYGFSHTHLSGTGCSDYGDVLLMPFTGKAAIKNSEYCSKFSHANEKSSPGFYSVTLDKNNVKVELTAGQRVGVHRYTYPAGTSAKGFIIDLTHRDQVINSNISLVNGEIIGYRTSSAWNPHQYVAFSIQSSLPIKKIDFYSDDKLRNSDATAVSGKNCKAVVYFEESTKQVVLKVAISAVDMLGAQYNQLEIKDFAFDKIKLNAEKLWDTELGKIVVESKDEELKKTFYTALYHCFTSPYLYSDIDGRYRGMDQNIYLAQDHDVYTVFSLWDTYRALHPLLALIDRNRTEDFIYSFIKHYEQGGMLPMWELSSHETWCMIGYHAVSVIYDAITKDIGTFDKTKLLNAMVESAKLDQLGRTEFAKYGYIPGDMEHESVSKTLEYAYDDWCISEFAKLAGNYQLSKEFAARSQAYKNILDVNGFMRPKINGGFVTPFDPTEVNNHFTEANCWQYSTYVPHDFENYINLIGGKEVAGRFLDQLFNSSSELNGRKQVDITGLVGQYAHGNEPSHHAAYLYNYVGQAWKTQELTRRIMQTLYSSKPKGLCGNEDCGQMSAWYVFSALGFYPVCPGDNQYVVGSPIFDRAIVNLENGKKIDITCENQSAKNCYIQSAKIDDKTLLKSFFTFKELKDGATIIFKMGDQPNKKWACTKADFPKSKIKATATVVPYFTTSNKTFKDDLTVEIKLYDPAAEDKSIKFQYPAQTDAIFYTLDGSTPTATSTKYTTPIKITKNTTLKAVASNPLTGLSKVVEANYYKYSKDKNVSIKSTYSSQYTAGGDDGLIDQLRGSKNYRLGGWQGYQGQDFEATIDLLSVKEINEIGAGFLEEIKSWIWFPKQVTFEISNDNKNFEVYGTVVNQHPDNDYEIKTEDFTVKKQAQARYIRVKAQNYGKIPTWHLGAGGNAFIFIDEIIVK